MIPKLTGTVKHGKLIPENPEAHRVLLSRHEGKRVHYTIKRFTHSKSNNQNRYYRGVVVPILADYWGYTEDEAHSAIGLVHFMVYPERGIPYVKSTQNDSWTTAEWEEKIEKIRIWAMNEFSVYIPLPNEVDCY